LQARRFPENTGIYPDTGRPGRYDGDARPGNQTGWVPVTPPEKRRRDIVELVTKHDGLSVERLADLLDVSASTIRRDLRELADRELIERAHGGAVPATNVGGEPSFDQRVVQQLDEKRAIADRAVEEIREGQIVFFDSGTTTMQVARAAPADGSFVAVTNSPLLALELGDHAGSVKSTGGGFRPETKALVGPQAELYIRSSNFDLAFLGVNGIKRTGGLTCPNEEEASVKRHVMDNATRSVVVTVVEKFGRQQFREFATVDEIDFLVTDDRVPDEFRDLFSATELAEETRW
jgi:DeoR family fructose operon transcriptional repressor